MILFPAIDLYDGKAVRLLKGDYRQMTVYSDKPALVAEDFRNQGAEWIHLVDLQGARDGGTPNRDTVRSIVEASSLNTEIGGGIRNMETVEAYLSIGVSRVILGTAAVTDRPFLEKAAEKYGSRIAVGVDINDGRVAIKGWTETSELDAFDFCRDLENIGICTVICTDISKDGAMKGTNRRLYMDLSAAVGMQITASGGISDMDDIRELAGMGLYGAIIGKAYYTGAINLKDAIRESAR